MLAPFSPFCFMFRFAFALPFMTTHMESTSASAAFVFSCSSCTVMAESKPESIRTAAAPAAIVLRILFLIRHLL